MSQIIGWYYLHENGQLIYKPYPDAAEDIRDSDFAKAMWPFYTDDRANAWRLLVEAKSLNADKSRVEELAKKWGINDKDAIIYADYIGAVLQMDGDQWCATRSDFTNLQESPAGFGDTCLEALSDLCKQLGFEGGKMWNATFHDLMGAK